MIFAIFHKANPNNILAKFEASSNADAFQQYINHRPELEVETVAEFTREYPGLASCLMACALC
jgi:hypothetical protein